MNITIDDCPPDAAVSSNIYVREDDAVLDLRVGVDAHVRRNNTFSHCASRDDAAVADNRVYGRARSARLAEHEFYGWILALVRSDGPFLVVQVKDRRYRDKIHVRFIKSFQRSHVPPVERLLLVLINEVEGINFVLVQNPWQDVLAKIMRGSLILGVL